MTATRRRRRPFTVVDLFSGGGGMSYGFHAHPAFAMAGAADAQFGKPSSPAGSLACNSTYRLNMGFDPVSADLSTTDPRTLRAMLGLRGSIDVLSACPPCTGFSRANSMNHVVDDQRNSLVTRVALYAEELDPTVVVMENARELLIGNFRQHFDTLEDALHGLGYEVASSVSLLTAFGLPQVRERALVVAVKRGLIPRTLDDLWEDFEVDGEAITVRRAISHLPQLQAGRGSLQDPDHASPAFGSPTTRARMEAIPRDGGSWRDLITAAPQYLTPAMHRLIAARKLGNHPDVYGRMFWDRPAPTIKRECGHVGNGRYAHPSQTRLCSLREMALLNGFPETYRFGGRSLVNRYRHVGDAVPPLISYQIAHAVSWALTGVRPAPEDIVLEGTSLRPSDVRRSSEAAA
ncbi:DNA cytosine methyltransferase [Mycobacterium marinum]|uniref:DNA cytosine methyltransferase n=1 Tax=Mycobacterium marinum TaxID=1781 RepID=UPI003569A8BB